MGMDWLAFKNLNLTILVQEAPSVPICWAGGLGRAGTWSGKVAGLGSSQQPHLLTTFSPSTHFPGLASKGHQLNTIANV